MKRTLKWWNARGYIKRPLVSFVLETYNLSRPVVVLVKELRKVSNSEIIVVDDGSSYDHARRVLGELTGVNEFFLRSNDLFGTLTMNRAFDFARGKYIAKLQDDDRISGAAWVDEAVRLFEAHADLAILSGRASIEFVDDWHPKDGVTPNRLCEKFEFVQAIIEAPMWLRKESFTELGGFDEDFGPFLWSEPELCFRAWLAGKSVGLYRPDGVTISGVKTGRRRAARAQLHAEANARNKRILYEKFAGRFAEIRKMAKLRNKIEDNRQ